MLRSVLLLSLLAPPLSARAATIVSPVEDVMTSSFFFGPNYVRGYAGDSRPVFRVSTNDPFGTTGAETIYLTFDPADFAGFTAPIESAVLSVQSVDGGFGANAGPGAPFVVSAHGVSADPLTSITDDTNPSGATDWFDFLNNNVLAADPAALTTVDSLGVVEFDVTGLVNDWLTDAGAVFAVALTGLNDASGGEFLHGFANNTETPGATFLTLTAVPEPSSLLAGVVASVAVVAWTVRPSRSTHHLQ